jgi:hypothetical protein
VLVSGSTILAVEPATATAPADCPVTELHRGTLLPGLIDAHVHLCGNGGPRALDQLPELGDIEIDAIVAPSLAAQLASGVTAVRDLGDARWTVVDRHWAHPQGPTVGRSGPPITCVNGHCAGMGGEASGEDGLRRAVRRLELPGCDDVDGGALILEHDDLTGWHVEPGAIARERGDGSLPRPGSARFLSVVCHSARWPFPGSVRARSGSRGRPR